MSGKKASKTTSGGKPAVSKTPQPSPHRRLVRHEPAWALAAAVFAIAVIPYLNTLKFGFVNYDDPTFIIENVMIRDGGLSGIRELFTAYFVQRAPLAASPVTKATWMLDYRLGGGGATWFHLGNVLLHGVGAALLFMFLSRGPWKAWTAALVAVLWAVHPVHSESVAWAMGRKDVLSGALMFGAMLAYGKLADSAGKKAAMWYLAALVLWIAAVLAKPVAVVMPLMLAVWVLAFEQKALRKKLLAGLAIYILPVVFFVVWQYLISQNAGATGVWPGGGFAAAQTGNAMTIANYAVTMLAPVRLSAQYDPAALMGMLHGGGAVAAGWTLTLLLAGACVYAIIRKRNLAVCLLFSAIPILPVLNIFPTAIPIADRYLYIPAVGLCLAAGVTAARLIECHKKGARIAGFVLAGALMAAFSIGAYARNGVWRDSETLWQDALRKYPGSVVATNNLAQHYIGTGRLDEAVELLEGLSEAGGKGQYAAMIDLAVIHTRRGEYEKARDYYITAFADPETRGNIKLQSAYGALLVNMDRLAEAIPVLEAVRVADADNSSARGLLCICYENTSRNAEALTACGEYVSSGGRDPEALWSYGKALFMARQYEQAASVFRTFIAVFQGNTAPAWVNLGICYEAMGRHDEARSLWMKALEIDPENKLAAKYLSDEWKTKGF